MKVEAIRANCPRTLEEAEEAEALVEKHVRHYNHVRLDSGIGWITPADKLAGLEAEIWAERGLGSKRRERRVGREGCAPGYRHVRSRRLRVSCSRTKTQPRGATLRPD